jgi:hypothetical protein
MYHPFVVVDVFVHRLEGLSPLGCPPAALVIQLHGCASKVPPGVIPIPPLSLPAIASTSSGHRGVLLSDRGVSLVARFSAEGEASASVSVTLLGPTADNARTAALLGTGALSMSHALASCVGGAKGPHVAQAILEMGGAGLGGADARAIVTAKLTIVPQELEPFVLASLERAAAGAAASGWPQESSSELPSSAAAPAPSSVQPPGSSPNTKTRAPGKSKAGHGGDAGPVVHFGPPGLVHVPFPLPLGGEERRITAAHATIPASSTRLHPPLHHVDLGGAGSNDEGPAILDDLLADLIREHTLSAAKVRAATDASRRSRRPAGGSPRGSATAAMVALQAALQESGLAPGAAAGIVATLGRAHGGLGEAASSNPGAGRHARSIGLSGGLGSEEPSLARPATDARLSRLSKLLPISASLLARAETDEAAREALYSVVGAASSGGPRDTANRARASDESSSQRPHGGSPPRSGKHRSPNKDPITGVRLTAVLRARIAAAAEERRFSSGGSGASASFSQSATPLDMSRTMNSATETLRRTGPTSPPPLPPRSPFRPPRVMHDTNNEFSSLLSLSAQSIAYDQRTRGGGSHQSAKTTAKAAPVSPPPAPQRAATVAPPASAPELELPARSQLLAPVSMPQPSAHDVTSATAVSHISSLVSQTASTISGASSSESASILQVTRASRDADASQERHVEPRSPSVDPALFISALSPSPRRHGNTPNERASARGAQILESTDASIGSISGSDDSDSEHKAPVPAGAAKAIAQPAASPLEDVYEDDGEFDVDSGSASKSSGESVAMAPLPLAASSSASIGSLALSSGERFGSSGGFSGESGAQSATSAATARARDIAAAHAARMALLRKDDVPDSPDLDDSPSNVMSAIEIYKARAANVRRLAPTSFGDPRRADLSPTSDDVSGDLSDDNF